jgi:hypothetical protein
MKIGSQFETIYETFVIEEHANLRQISLRCSTIVISSEVRTKFSHILMFVVCINEVDLLTIKNN